MSFEPFSGNDLLSRAEFNRRFAAMLTDETAAMHGLGAEATPDEVFRVLGRKVLNEVTISESVAGVSFDLSGIDTTKKHYIEFEYTGDLKTVANVALLAARGATCNVTVAYLRAPGATYTDWIFDRDKYYGQTELFQFARIPLDIRSRAKDNSSYTVYFEVTQNEIRYFVHGSGVGVIAINFMINVPHGAVIRFVEMS